MPFLVLRKKDGAELSRVVLGREAVLIGRLKPAQICVDDPIVSGAHAKVWLAEGRIVLRDLSSRNGTYVNGVRVTETELAPGDQVQIGGAVIAVESEGAAVAPLLVQAPATGTPPPPAITKSPSGERASTVRMELRSVRDSAFDVARQEDDRLSLVWQAGEQLNLLSEPQAIYDSVQALAARAFDPARAFVLRTDDGGATFHVGSGSAGDARPPSRSVCQEACATRSAVLSKSMSTDERFSTAESVVSSRIETVIAAPLVCRGAATAIIYLDRLGGRPFGEKDLRLLGLIANHTSSKLESAALVDDLRRSNEELGKAHEELGRWSHELEAKVEARTAEVRAQAAEIAALAAEKDQLLGIAAHDIRGPLTTILGYLGIARGNLRAADPDSLDQDLAVVEDSARGIARLLTDFLDLKKIEAGKIRIEPARTDARAFLDQSTALGALTARQRGLRFSVEAEPGLTIHGDPKRLEQALSNLVQNALKFVRREGTVTVRAARAPDGGVEVSVSDDGPGMPPEELKNLFGAFVQGEAGRRASSGTGLGLAIAKKLIELHGGRIYAESGERKGSRFAFWVPDPPGTPVVTTPA